ncbi:cytochrome P450 [Schizopora paradoxa]|uniref:Cytochrome P450 n=1 Tax=Schizopora paradoxa TaxID=27342 RepID=A0A0H2RPN6_9AGAM|nr:cytochrome P450 [Schizopora paradoxa]
MNDTFYSNFTSQQHERRQFLLPFSIAAAAIIYILTRWITCQVGSRKTYPPGPPGHPIAGNIFQLPIHKPWLYFQELGKTYGPITHLKLGYEEVVVLHKAADAGELLGHRSHNYSLRRPLIYAGKYLTDNNVMVLSCGDRWTSLRAAYHSMFQTREMPRYSLLTELESSKLVLDLLDTPLHEDLTRTIQHFTASVIYAIVYGRRLADGNKDFEEILEIADSFVKDCYPGAHLVDTFPFLDSLPDILALWRKEAYRKRDWQLSFYTRVAEKVRKEMEENTALDCFTTRLFERPDFDSKSIMQATGEMFQAGTDTMASTMLWFFVAMLLYPEALRKAQAELDKVLGSDGTVLPGLHHLKDLPYCVAVMKETFRWMPVVPGGFPHLSDAEDAYKGYTIKAKTVVIPNIWSMHRDEGQYPNSSEFIPERHLHDETPTLSGLTDGHHSFGFGRRICPGRMLASQTIWIAITRIMWACNVDYAKSLEGKLIPIDLNNSTSQILSRPLPFPVKITPRSQTHQNTVRAEWNNLKEAPVFLPPDTDSEEKV